MFLVTNASTGLDACHSVLGLSLSERQAAIIELSLQDGWSIDRHVDFDNGLALMISATGLADTDVAFYVDAEPVGLSLSILRDDMLEHRGCYGSVESLITAIRAAA